MANFNSEELETGTRLNKEQVKADHRTLSDISQRQEKRVRNLESRAFELVISYVILLILIYSSVSNSSSITCTNWWVPTCLSICIALIFFVTFFDVLGKYTETKYQYELILIDLETLQLEIIAGPRQRQVALKPDALKVYKLSTFKYFVVACLLAFTVVILGAFHSIIC